MKIQFGWRDVTFYIMRSLHSVLSRGKLFEHLTLNSVGGESRLEIGFWPTQLSVEWVKQAKATGA
jgi:hypothetical protein